MAENFPSAPSPEKKLEEMTLAELEQKIAVLTRELQVLLATPDPAALEKLGIIEIPRKINERALYEMQRQKLILLRPPKEE